MTTEKEKLEIVKNWVKDQGLRESMPQVDFDVEAEVYFLRTEDGGRHTPAVLGYRPGHYVTEDIMTTGVHYYVNQDYVFPGHQAKTLIKFISPKHYPNCLWVGKKVKINEGATTIGYAKITSILNGLLEK